MNKRLFNNGLALAVIIMAECFVGVIAKGNKPEVRDSQQDIYTWLKTYSEIISLVEKKAFRPIDFSAIIQSSLKAAAAEVDAHTAFFGKDSYKSAIEQTSGEFSGIGVSIITKAPDDEALAIIDVIEGGPAHGAGLKGGDKIVEVDGEKLKGLSADEAVAKLKGKVGSVVVLKVVRAKKPLEFKVKRNIIQDQSSLCFNFTQHKIYYLSLKLFTENAASKMEVLLRKANEGACKGIVLDLRRNPGGILQSAIDMAGLFLHKGSLVAVTKNKAREVVDKYYTKSDPILKAHVPIFILIDNFTASAAEILAGCLKHYASKGESGKKKGAPQVFLVGVSTFGKGSVQEVIPVSNDCALKLTTMLYYLPDDLSIQATGIEPDFTVKPRFVPVDEMRWVAEMYGKESSLKRHITVAEVTGKEEDKKKKKSDSDSVLDDVELGSDSKVTMDGNGGSDDIDDPEKAKKWEDKMREELGRDVQVQAAINLINMLDLAKKCGAPVKTRDEALSFLKSHYVTDDPVTIEQVK